MVKVVLTARYQGLALRAFLHRIRGLGLHQRPAGPAGGEKQQGFTQESCAAKPFYLYVHFSWLFLRPFNKDSPVFHTVENRAVCFLLLRKLETGCAALLSFSLPDGKACEQRQHPCAQGCGQHAVLDDAGFWAVCSRVDGRGALDGDLGGGNGGACFSGDGGLTAGQSSDVAVCVHVGDFGVVAFPEHGFIHSCLLYTSDAADDDTIV